MELKDYQVKVIDSLSIYLEQLKRQIEAKSEFYQFQIVQGREAALPEESDYCNLAWDETKKHIAVCTSNYSSRRDGVGRKIPNICFKVPTGGGKTLLACHAILRINQDYFTRNNGFILWVVPSETIYSQTLKQLRNKEHPYRQILDRASGGKVKILEKADMFNHYDLEDYLCVMLLMLQSGNRQTKDTLRLFRDSGKFMSFFPAVDDYTCNLNLLKTVPNLERTGLADQAKPNVITGISIKHSLGNVLRLMRPIVIIDEGHRATTTLALDTINSFNPRFILELSATPKPSSNILANVGGIELKQEQMIKLPINIFSYENTDWKSVLNHAFEQHVSLAKSADRLQANEGKYIRPIMLIKAEAKRKESDYDQVTEIKQYLINNLGIREAEIRIKLSQKDEIGNEDLLNSLCPVRYIITKDALKEGWDCSFAYLLVILSNTKGETSLTQFIGRVLRQPYAQATSTPQLNRCYVYCINTDVNIAVAGIKKGLEEEGLHDLHDQVQSPEQLGQINEQVIIKRKARFKGLSIFLPTLNVIINGQLRNFDYNRDILSEVDWSKYKFTRKTEHSGDIRSTFRHGVADYRLGQQLELIYQKHITQDAYSPDYSLAIMTGQLMENIPNPWQAARIINTVICTQISRLTTAHIVEEIKTDAKKWFMSESEKIFKEKVERNQIVIKLIASEYNRKFNWQMPEELMLTEGKELIAFDKNLFEPQFRSWFNDFEYKVAGYINNTSAIKWWHRLATKGSEYYIQGWQRDKLYPDFLLAFESNNRITKLKFLETKGEHLKGNDKTEYIRKLFDFLTHHINKPLNNVGQFQLVNDNLEIDFNLIMQDQLETDLKHIVNN